jgi:tetratricopeptide (TPR) repeat protein
VEQRSRTRLSIPAALALAAAAAVAAPQPVAPAAPLERAYAAAMDGRKADALAALQGADAAAGTAGSELAGPYAVLVRFGLWDELIALGPPDPRSPALTAGYLYGRGVALAARGRLDEARGALEALGQLAATAPPLADVIAVAAPVVAARIAASARDDEAAVAALLQAVAAEDRLTPTVPGGWFFPVRDLLGAQLLIAGHAAEAERIYREDLARNPGSGWALYGLAAAQRAQGRMRAAAVTQREFARAWKHADVRLEASAFWFAGPDTTSCECQRPSFR